MRGKKEEKKIEQVVHESDEMEWIEIKTERKEWIKSTLMQIAPNLEVPHACTYARTMPAKLYELTSVLIPNSLMTYRDE